MVKLAQLALVIVHGEFDIDGGTGIILILNLGLGQRRLVLGAPVHGLQALIDITLFVHGTENLHFLGLKTGVHGLVGVLPVADDAHALESSHLNVDILLGVVVAGGAELGHAHLLAVELLLLDDGGFNGHAVVVPAGDIGSVVAPHGVGAGDKVLDGFVQGVAHVQAAVGEGRAVMEGKPGLALVLFQQFVVDVDLLPALQHFRLAGGQTGPHGEVGLRQVNGLVVVHCDAPYLKFGNLGNKKPSPLVIQETKARTSAVPLSLPENFRPLTPHSHGVNGISAVSRRALLRFGRHAPR